MFKRTVLHKDLFSRTGILGLMALLVLSVSACGTKPDHVDPPANADPQKFPRTYPDIKIDPAPVAAPRG